MQIDRQSLNKLLSMNDTQLKLVISRIAAESGIDLSEFNINPKDIESVRRALSSASDSDLARIAENYKQNRKK